MLNEILLCLTLLKGEGPFNFTMYYYYIRRSKVKILYWHSSG